MGKFYGVGVNDLGGTNRHHRSYVTWKTMLERCYCPSFLKRHPTYAGCEVCDEWKVYSVFKKWFDERNPPRECELDKDILSNGSKMYSPETCCFVPHKINTLFEQRKESSIGEIGVCRNNGYAHGKAYLASLSVDGKTVFIGDFDTVEEAAVASKEVRAAYRSYIASLYYYRGLIDTRVYRALKQKTII